MIPILHGQRFDSFFIPLVHIYYNYLKLIQSLYDGDIMPNSPNSFKVHQRRKRRVADQAMMGKDDVYHNFARQDVINPPLDCHYDDIQRLDFGGSTI